jgi:phosphoglycerate dehydrogenase-like enzyme
MSSSTLLVTMEASAESRRVIAERVGDVANVIYLSDLDERERMSAIGSADAILAMNTAKELRPGEIEKLSGVKIIQFISSGVDFVPLSELPTDAVIASNGGAYAEPMAEHAVAMALAAFKRLLVEHDKMKAGEFDQFRPNRMLVGSVCGILGFGGIGVATARLMKGLGVKVHAVNRRGATDEDIDWIGTADQTDDLLSAADILVLSLPLTPATEGSIDRRALELMKRDAVLINLARGEVIDETALYSHLKANPDFVACIDAWWIEPIRHGRFEMKHGFFGLPNVIASPHNSASVKGWRPVAVGRAIDNILRVLEGGEARFQVKVVDRML